MEKYEISNETLKLIKEIRSNMGLNKNNIDSQLMSEGRREQQLNIFPLHPQSVDKPHFIEIIKPEESKPKNEVEEIKEWYNNRLNTIFHNSI